MAGVYCSICFGIAKSILYNWVLLNWLHPFFPVKKTCWLKPVFVASPWVKLHECEIGRSLISLRKFYTHGGIWISTFLKKTLAGCIKMLFKHVCWLSRARGCTEMRDSDKDLLEAEVGFREPRGIKTTQHVLLTLGKIAWLGLTEDDLLIAGLEHSCYFSIYCECHHPNWRTHIFQRGWNHQPV